MAWQTPKVDWSPEDGVLYTDINRIEGNTLDLHTRYNKIAPNIMTEDLIVYVSTSGNDTTGDGGASTPFKTIGKALSMIPHTMSGHSALISIAAGTYSEWVELYGYDGQITFAGTSGATVVVSGFRVDEAKVGINNITLRVNSGVFVTGNSSLTGTGTLHINGYTLTVNYNASFDVPTVIVDNASGYAIEVNRNGRFFASAISGSGSANGIRCQTGGIVAFGTNSLTVRGTQYVTATGGRIYSGAQHSIPEY